VQVPTWEEIGMVVGRIEGFRAETAEAGEPNPNLVGQLERIGGRGSSQDHQRTLETYKPALEPYAKAIADTIKAANGGEIAQFTLDKVFYSAFHSIFPQGMKSIGKSAPALTDVTEALIQSVNRQLDGSGTRIEQTWADKNLHEWPAMHIRDDHHQSSTYYVFDPLLLKGEDPKLEGLEANAKVIANVIKGFKGKFDPDALNQPFDAALRSMYPKGINDIRKVQVGLGEAWKALVDATNEQLEGSGYEIKPADAEWRNSMAVNVLYDGKSTFYQYHLTRVGSHHEDDGLFPLIVAPQMQPGVGPF
jgi:hypothetical protein